MTSTNDIANPSPMLNVVCKTCGSDDIRLNGVASWNRATQKWQLDDIFIGQACYCVDCKKDVEVIFKELETEDVSDLRLFTVFVQQVNGKGTIHISSHEACDIEEAKKMALDETADDWGYGDIEELRILGVATGDVDIREWFDLDG